MDGGEALTVFAGIGCRAQTPASEIVAVVREACARLQRGADALAAPAFKAAEAGLSEAARLLGLRLVLVDQAALIAAQALCVTHSAASAHATGVASVAEGSALAAAGPGARLILPRITHARATCALAETAP